MQAAASPSAGAEPASDLLLLLCRQRGDRAVRWSKAVEELEMLQVSVCEGRREESRAELSISQRHCLGNKARLSSSVRAKQAVLLAGVTAACVEGSGVGASFL